MSNHPPKILFLYGSLRERSYSRLLAEEAARISYTRANPSVNAGKWRFSVF